MNNEKILAHVRMFVLREKLLCPGEPLHLAAAVSGGADSMALLRILLALQPEFGFVLSACHVNHGLRGESADRDKAFVRAECARLGVPLRVFHAAEMADEVGLPSEHRMSVAFACKAAVSISFPFPFAARSWLLSTYDTR